MEIWKDIPDYEDLYQASTMGRIKSLERKVVCKNGQQINIKERILSILASVQKQNTTPLKKISVRREIAINVKEQPATSSS